MTFEVWLAQQVRRRDEVGRLALRMIEGGTESLQGELGSREDFAVVHRATAEWRRSSSPGAPGTGGAGAGHGSAAPPARASGNAPWARGGEPCPCGCLRKFRGKVPTGAALDALRERHRQVDEKCRASNAAAGLSERVRTARSR